MYTDGIVVAFVLGVVALLVPALWVGWWLIADLGEKVSGATRAPSYRSAGTGVGRAAYTGI